MYCPQCGFKNEEGSRHCSQCGAQLSQPVQAQPAQPVYQPPAQPTYQPPPAQPYYPPPPYGAQGVPLVPATVPNYMVQAILVTLFCCLPLGIVGIFRARDVNKRLAAGDYEGALDASKSARTILWWGFGSGLVISIIYAIAAIANVASNSGSMN